MNRHNKTGPPQRELYTQRGVLLNKGATQNGWKDYGYFDWYSDYWVENMDEVFLQLWENVKPLYVQLHAYVRFKLRELNPDKFEPYDPIPGHLLGNLLMLLSSDSQVK